MTTYSGVPSLLRVADSWNITVRAPEYPAADGWVVRLVLTGRVAWESLASEATDAGGGAWTISVPRSRTMALGGAAGLYGWALIAERTDERTTLGSGYLEVLDDPTTMGAQIAQLEADLAAVEAAITGRLTDDLQAYTIQGRSLTMIPIRELLRIRAQLLSQRRRLITGEAWPRIRLLY